MAAPSYVRDETRSKTYDKTSVEERSSEKVKHHVHGMTMKQVRREGRTTYGKIVTVKA